MFDVACTSLTSCVKADALSNSIIINWGHIQWAKNKWRLLKGHVGFTMMIGTVHFVEFIKMINPVINHSIGVVLTFDFIKFNGLKLINSNEQ